MIMTRTLDRTVVVSGSKKHESDPDPASSVLFVFTFLHKLLSRKSQVLSTCAYIKTKYIVCFKTLNF